MNKLNLILISLMTCCGAFAAENSLTEKAEIGGQETPLGKLIPVAGFAGGSSYFAPTNSVFSLNGFSAGMLVDIGRGDLVLETGATYIELSGVNKNKTHRASLGIADIVLMPKYRLPYHSFVKVGPQFISSNKSQNFL